MSEFHLTWLELVEELVNGMHLLLTVSWTVGVTLVNGSGWQGRHAPGVQFTSVRIQGIQRRGDGKDCFPLTPLAQGRRRASLAIFFLDLGLGEVCTWDAWNLPSEGTGVGGFPAGQSSRRDQCTGTGPFSLAACVCV